MSMGNAGTLEGRCALSAAVQQTRRAVRDAQWRAWLAASEARGQGAGRCDVADLRVRGNAGLPRAEACRRAVAILAAVVGMLVALSA